MRLSAIARGRAVAYEKVLTEFLLERLVARLIASHALGTKFIFKGGTSEGEHTGLHAIRSMLMLC